MSCTVLAGTVLFKLKDKDGHPIDHVVISQEIERKCTRSTYTERSSPGEFRTYSIEPGTHKFILRTAGVGRAEIHVEVKSGEESVAVAVLK